MSSERDDGARGRSAKSKKNRVVSSVQPTDLTDAFLLSPEVPLSNLLGVNQSQPAADLRRQEKEDEPENRESNWRSYLR